tara:strand:- start:313 stop:618 length:306 start_codon:yes stop_codon:yes gene_type:complete
MRVNITYSEELENIPDLITEFMRESGKSLLWLSNHVANIDGVEVRDVLKSGEILELIDKTRQSLAVIDQRLDDAARLLSGYNNAIQGNVNGSEEDLPIDSE